MTPSARLGSLLKFLELFERYAELTEDFEEERRANLASTVQWDRYGAAIKMIPSFVTARLSFPDEAELACHPLEVVSGGTRHGRSQ